MRHATFVLLVAFAACKGGAAKESCRREAADLQALLRAADTGDRTLRIPRDAKLVMRDDLPEPKDMPPAPVVHLRANRLSIDGNDAASVAGMVDNRGDGRWFVVIDADVAWSRVVEVVSAGMQSPVFVFTGSDPVKAPRRVPIDDAIDAIDAAPDTGAMRIAELMAEQIKSCPSLQKVFGSVATVPGKSRSEFIIEGIGTGLVECQCNANIPNVRALLFRVMHDPHPPRILAFDGAATAAPISLPATTLWSEASKQLKADLKNAKLEVKP